MSPGPARQERQRRYAPDDLYTDAYLQAPAGAKGGIFGVHLCYSGEAGQAESVLAPFRSSDQTDPRNEGEYLNSGFINDLGANRIAAVMAGFEAHPDRGTSLYFQHSGGAIGRIAADATAFPHRRSTHNMLASVPWPLAGDPAPHVQFVKAYWATLERFTDGYYTNEVADEAQGVVNANYQGNLARLQAVKNRYDPGNPFRLNANVEPTV